MITHTSCFPNSVQPSSKCKLLLYFCSGDGMKWLNEKPLVFTNWESGDQSDLLLSDTCVALHSDTGKWENVSCADDVENGVVCEAVQGEESLFCEGNFVYYSGFL